MTLDEHEKHLLMLLEDLQKRYHEEAKPIVDQLVKIKNLRPLPPMILTKEEAARLVSVEIRCEGGGGPGGPNIEPPLTGSGGAGALTEDEK